MKEILERHYKNIAQEYEYYLNYSPDFVRSLATKMIDKLDLQPTDLFVDLGGGTGMYSQEIHRHVRFEKPTLCVDPFQEMLDQIPPEANMIKPLCMDAVAFSANGDVFNKVLIKEAIHHIVERRRLFENLFKKLPSRGRVLLVHVPPQLQYPIFEDALKRALEWHACPNELVEELRAAGFEVHRDALGYRHRIPKEKYFAQVKTRFMSVLHHFDDLQMEAGLREMEDRYGHESVLEFVDHFDYLTAIKP